MCKCGVETFNGALSNIHLLHAVIKAIQNDLHVHVQSTILGKGSTCTQATQAITL